MNAKIQRWHAPRILLRLIWVALTILLVLQVCDVLSTIRFVGRLGIEAEENPLARMFFIRYGIAGLWLHKLLIIPFIVSVSCILLQISRKYVGDEKNQALLVSFLTFFLSAVIYLNMEFVAIVLSNLAPIP
ncbi:MAG: hypothetical protein AAB920_00505 [Patescibacteria group bacterium]